MSILVVHNGLVSLKLNKWLRRVHLWAGLLLGIPVVVLSLSLSGAALVFYNELDGALNLPATPACDSCSPPQLIAPRYDRALHTLRQTYPDLNGPWRVEASERGRVIAARYYHPPATQGEYFAPLMVWLSADGSAVVRQEYWGHYLMTWLYNLHFSLLSGATGLVVVGMIGVGTTLLLLSGLLAWWPRPGQWRRALAFKRRPALVGQLYDWHKVTGLVMVIPLVLLCVTGAMLALPKQTSWVLSQGFGPVNTPQPLFGQNAGGAKADTVPPAVALEQARSHYPTATLAWIETPAVIGTPDYYRFRFSQQGDPSRRFPHTFVYISAADSTLLYSYDFHKQNHATTIVNWLHALHDGTYFGLAGRIFYVLAGMAMTILFILGAIRYYWRTCYKRRGDGSARHNTMP